MKYFSILVLAITITFVGAMSAQVCPAVGNDTDCGVIITITDSGASLSFTGQGPFDGIEDTLVGVVNKSKLPIHALGLTSTQTIFDFDGDGIVAFGIPGNSQDGTGYGGPNAFFTNINSSRTSGTVNFIVPIAAGGGTGFFSLEDAISSATACSSLINNALTGPSGSGTPSITASFTPNNGFSLSDAAALCGFSDFDWQQTITSWPRPSPLFQIGNPVALSAPPPFLDPPPGGYTYEVGGDNSFPFYYDHNNGELKSHETATTLSFLDTPSDPCLPGGSGAGCKGKTAIKGSKLAFTTHLAGVNFDGTATDLGIGFIWTSTFNGTSGGVATTKNGLPADPGSGTGGVTIISVNQITNFQGINVTGINGAGAGASQTLSSGDACDGVFGGTFTGDVTVSPGQNCVFTNGTITGNVHQKGGTLALSGVLVGGQVQVSGGTFSFGPFAEIDGNLEIQNLTDGTGQNQICNITVEGNMHLHNNGVSIQVGSNSLSSCAGNAIGGDLEVHNNSGSTTIFGNTITGNLHDHNNSGSTQLFNNISNHLQCQNNESIIGSSNTADVKQGQCIDF